jgi:Ca2+-binding RTX toxin-like protein
MSSTKPEQLSVDALHGVVGGFNEQSGGAGNDTLMGGTNGDKLMGSATWGTGSDGSSQPVNSGNDVLDGGAGTDELHGGDGDDHIRMGTGDWDRAFGGDGNDVFWWRPGDGNDEVHGGAGADGMVLQSVSVDQVVAGLQMYQGSYTVVDNAIVFNGSANGQVTINGETIRFYGLERIAMPDSVATPPPPPPTTPETSSNGAVITGTAGDDNLSGSNTWGTGSDGSWQPQGSGNNLFNTGAGNDQAHGGDGADTFRLGVGDDKGFGGDGNDTFYWGPNLGNDEYHGGAGQDSVVIERMSLADVIGGLSMYGGASYSVTGNTITFNGPSSGQITFNGQTMKFFGMEKITISAT